MMSVDMARKRSSLGFLFWLGLVLLVLLVFVFSRPTIERVLDSTDFFAAVRPGDSSPVVVLRPSGEAPRTLTRRKPAADPGEATEQELQPDARPQADPAPEAVSARTPAVETETSPSSPAEDRSSRVFFVSLNDDGEIALRAVQRPVSPDAAPLTSMLRALLAGPTAAEQRRDIISLIPHEVELHRVSVRDGTAVIDLGQAFRFNSLGREGLLARLKQLVYSATEFPTVDAVQVLIDGDNVDYLGPEGLYIGEPLTRESFNP